MSSISYFIFSSSSCITSAHSTAISLWQISHFHVHDEDDDVDDKIYEIMRRDLSTRRRTF